MSDDPTDQMINRRVAIENLLIKMAAGDLPLPGKEDCRVLALRLGTPKDQWSDLIRDHQFGEESE